MRRECFQFEITGFELLHGLQTHVFDQGLQQRYLPCFTLCIRPIHEVLCEIRQRHAMTTDFLWQGFEQGLYFFLNHACNQPFALRRRDKIQHRHRHRQRHTVSVRTRLKMVGQRTIHATDVHAFREHIGGHARRLMTHQFIARQIQTFRLGFDNLVMPFLQGTSIANLLRNHRIVKRNDQLIIDQNILPP